MTIKSKILGTSSLLAACFLAACSSDGSGNGGAQGGQSSGGSASGGAASGGTPGNGGAPAQGGSANGGSNNPSGGSANGGATSSGGSANPSGGSNNQSGGNANGGATSSGGSSSGGSSNGGSSAGGSSSTGGSSMGGGSSTGGGGDGGPKQTGYTCPSVAPGTNPLPSNPTPTVINGAPPADSFNGNNNDFKILEGPVWFQDALYFSEIKNGSNPPPARVLKVTSSGTVSIAIPPEKAGTNGLAIDASGKLIGANHTQGAIVTLDPTGAAAAVPIVGMFMGKRFNSPNDLTVRSDGNIYFTDPTHQADPKTAMNKRVYRVAPNGSTATEVADYQSSQPNGITLSLDGNTLFVSNGPDSGGIDKYPLNSDGSVGTKSQLTNSFNSDGMGMDCAGNLYLSQSTKIVIISSTTGQKVGEIPVSGVQATTNVAFGGPEHKTLYITSLGNNAKVLKLEMNVPGLPY